MFLTPEFFWREPPPRNFGPILSHRTDFRSWCKISRQSGDGDRRSCGK